MFCTSCGKQVPDNAGFCTSCGKRLNLNVVNVYTPDYRYNEYRRLGGVLLFFVVIGYIGLAYSIVSAVSMNYTICSALGTVGQYLGKDALNGITGYILFFDVITVVTTVLEFIVLKSIREEEDNFLKIYQILYIVNVVTTTLLYIIGYGLLGDYASYFGVLGVMGSGFLLSWFITVIIITIGFIIWNVYFTRSVRVCVYMGSDRYLRESIFNKYTSPPIDVTALFNQGTDDSLSYISPIHKDKDVYANNSLVNKNTGDWKCPNCNRINSAYVGTCGCGRSKNGERKPPVEEKKPAVEEKKPVAEEKKQDQKVNLKKTEEPKEQTQTKAPEAISESEAIERIKQYKELLDSGIITQEEFNKKKAKLLDL